MAFILSICWFATVFSLVSILDDEKSEDDNSQ